MNPDEITTIRNKKTGEIKQVKRSELPSFGLPVDYKSPTDVYANSVADGTTLLEKVPETYRASTMASLDSKGVTIESIDQRRASAEMKKKQTAKTAQASTAKKDLEQFEKNFNQAGLRGKLLGNLPSITGLSPESADFDSGRMSLAYTLAGVIAGQEGRGISDADVKNFATLLPSRTDTDKEASNKMKNIKNMIGYRTGKDEGESLIGKDRESRDTGSLGGNFNANLGRLAQLPGQVANTIGQGVAEGRAPQEAIVGALPAITSGLVQEGGEFLRDPLRYAYENPLDTALAVAPVPKGTSALGKSVKAKTGSLPPITGSKMGQGVARNAFASNFTIPSKLAKRVDIDGVADVMIRNGHSGTLDELSVVAGKVTGQNGIFPKLNREALAQVKTPIDTGNVTGTASKALEDIPELDKAKRGAHLKVIEGLVKPGKEIGKADSLDAFQTIQELEKRGYQYKNSSTDLTPNLVNERIGDAYIRAADDLKDKLEGAYKDADVVSVLKTPQNIALVEQISPRLADDFKNAKTMKDLRKLQSPYVRLQRAIDLTQNASRTPFSQMAGSIARAGGSGLGAVVGGVTGGPVGSAVGAIAGGFAQPFIQPVVENILPRITTASAKKIGKKSNSSQLPR